MPPAYPHRLPDLGKTPWPSKSAKTIVTPSGDGTAVQLQISDAELGVEAAEIRLILHTKLPPFDNATLAHLQREAMKAAQNAMEGLLSDLAREIQKAGYLLDPRPKR